MHKSKFLLIFIALFVMVIAPHAFARRGRRSLEATAEEKVQQSDLVAVAKVCNVDPISSIGTNGVATLKITDAIKGCWNERLVKFEYDTRGHDSGVTYSKGETCLVLGGELSSGHYETYGKGVITGDEISGARYLTGELGEVVSNLKQIQKAQFALKDMTFRGNFGALLLLTQSDTFYEDWNKKEPPTPISLRLAHRNKTIFAFILFVNPSTEMNSVADVTWDITVRKPDGTVSVKHRDVVGWKTKYLVGKDHAQRAQGWIEIGIDPQDPAGTYVAEAVVRDNINRMELPLKVTFKIPQ